MMLLLVYVSTLPFSLVHGQQEQDVTIGSEVCTEGYIMDEFCITLGTLLDNDKVVTLEGPDQHSVHCLVDVSVCVESPYEILEDPTSTSNGLHVRAYRVDEAVDNGNGKQLLVNLARNVGTCSTCNGNGNLRFGMRAAVKGTITALQNGDIPPLLHVTEVLFGSKDELCVQQAVVAETSSPTESPTEVPIALTSSPTETPIIDTPSPTTMSPTTELPVMVDSTTSSPTSMTTSSPTTTSTALESVMMTTTNETTDVPMMMMNETNTMSNYTDDDVPMDMNTTDSNYPEESMTSSNWTTVPTTAPNSSSNIFTPEDTTNDNDPFANSGLVSSAPSTSFKTSMCHIFHVAVAAVAMEIAFF